MLLFDFDETGRQILWLTIFAMLLIGGLAEFIDWIKRGDKMKEYTVIISYSNRGEVCDYLYTGACNTMLEAISNGMSSFQEFMKERKTAVEILEVNAWIYKDPVEDCLKELNDDEYYEVTRHIK